MTKWSEIPGVVNGMFFEYYVFEPTTTFKPEDLAHIARFIDIVFNIDNPIPESATRHFHGRIFNPLDDLTVDEFADILNAMGIVAIPEIIDNLPKNLQEHFDEDGKFSPYEDFSFENLTDFLVRFLKLRISAEQFNTLTEKRLKRQFIVFTRDGKHWRWGSRIPG